MKNEALMDSMKSNRLEIDRELMNRSTTTNPHTIYKILILLSDIILSVSGFTVSAMIFIDHIDVLRNPKNVVTPAIFALAFISFFKLYRLYNYHIIYRLKKHATLLLLAFIMGFCIFVFSFIIYSEARPLSNFHLILVTVVTAVSMLLLKRYFEEFSIQIMVVLGISLIFVGLIKTLNIESTSAIIDSPSFVVTGVLFSGIGISLSRYLLVHQLFSKVMKIKFRRQTVIIGSEDQAQQISQYIIENNAPFWIAGVMGSSCWIEGKSNIIKENLGDICNLPKILTDTKASEVIVTDESIDKRTLIEILDYCAIRRINVWFPPSYMPIIDIKLYTDKFCGLPMVRLCTQKKQWLFNKLKHAFDALLTLPVFVIQLPVFLIIAAAVKLTSRGPVFYKATAIGKGGRSFSMLKFRSMVQDNDPTVHKEFVTRLIKGEIKRDNECGQVLKLTDDDRITSVGKFIRKFSLDELPQLINVLKGDMSLVGPRPCLPYEYEAYEEWHKKRSAIRPGITGLWQVTGRSEVSFEEMILLDLYYVYNRSFILDLNILFETAFVVIEKKGAC